MDFLIVSANKLKIIMTKEDMAKYSLSAGRDKYDDPKTRRTFWRILDVARDKCGFNATGEKLLIHFYPSGEGSELFVTKLGTVTQESERNITRSQNVTLLSSRNSIYRFSDTESLLSLSRRLSDNARDRAVALYFCDDGCYYLILEERGEGGFTDTFLFGEFACEVPDTLKPYISEHATRLCGRDALFKLAEL